MRLFVIFGAIQMHVEYAGATFRSRLSKLSKADKPISSPPIVSSKIRLSKQKSIQGAGKCMAPCQLEPYWIPFDTVLKLSDVPDFLYSSIRFKSALINIGKCIGFCKPSMLPLYKTSVRLKLGKTSVYFTDLMRKSLEIHLRILKLYVPQLSSKILKLKWLMPKGILARDRQSTISSFEIVHAPKFNTVARLAIHILFHVK